MGGFPMGQFGQFGQQGQNVQQGQMSSSPNVNVMVTKMD